MKRNEELRKLPAASLHGIADILETNNDWQKVMSLIPKDLENNNFEPKYNFEHIRKLFKFYISQLLYRLIEEHARNTNRKCADVLFDEWGTSGRIRPTLGTLMNVLLTAEQYRAADEIATMLQEPLPERPLRGPAAKINMNITSLLNHESTEQASHSMVSVKSANLKKKYKNGPTRNVLNNGTTKQMKSTSNPQYAMDNQSYDIPNIKAFQPSGQQSTAQILSETGDVNKLTDSQFYPDFNKLLKSENDLKTISTSSMSETSSINDSETTDHTTDETTESRRSQTQTGSIFQIPSNIYGQIDSGILEDANLIQFQYKELEDITNKFPEHLVEQSDGIRMSGKIGSGGFGDVFAGSHHKYGLLAVKKVRSYLQLGCTPDVANKVFNAEVKSLSHLRHNNIVPILGFSLDGPAPCIVCTYIEGGSLEEKIASKVLNEDERINIILGTAEGLKYIHNSIKPKETGNVSTDTPEPSTKKTYYLHGDIKSANILLTNDCVPKLCDFGLSKKYDTTIITKSIMGTQAYMAPESFNGTITQKSDIFSFGIVILELLTGRKPIVIENNERINIKNYVEDKCANDDISILLDPVVDRWTKDRRIYQLAKHCLQHDKNHRPSMNEVCDVINRMDHELYEIFYGHV